MFVRVFLPALLQFIVTLADSSKSNCKFQIEHQNGTFDVVSLSSVGNSDQNWKVETITFLPKDFAPNNFPPKVLKVQRNVSTAESQKFLGRYWLIFEDTETVEFNIRYQCFKTFLPLMIILQNILLKCFCTILSD
jgi:hypothetical protein